MTLPYIDVYDPEHFRSKLPNDVVIPLSLGYLWHVTRPDAAGDTEQIICLSSDFYECCVANDVKINLGDRELYFKSEEQAAMFKLKHL